MTKFGCKGRIRWKQCNLAYDWNMCALITQEDFIVKGSAHKVLIVFLHTLQVTQATSPPKAKPKTIFYISYDHLASSMAIVLSIHAFAKACVQSESWVAIQKGHFHRK